MRKTDQMALVGGLSKPTKMPGWAYGLPAQKCKIGGVLRKQGGTVCELCYAHKGMYVFPVVKQAQARRLAIVLRDPWEWSVNMSLLLHRLYARKSEEDRFFRWHDSGDLQSAEHFQAIIAIAHALPRVRFWLPSKEYAIVRAVTDIPDNLRIRLSAPVVGMLSRGLYGSTVDVHSEGHQCPAPLQGGECGHCRACWDPAVETVNYHLH